MASADEGGLVRDGSRRDRVMNLAREGGDEWPRERPIVWPVGAQIPIEDEEEVADAMRRSRRNSLESRRVASRPT